MIKVSNSKIKCWRRCKREAYYKYVEKIERRRPEPTLLRGRMIHDLVEAYYSPKRDWKDILRGYANQYEDLFIEEQEEYGDIIGDMKRVIKSYAFNYKKDSIKYIKGHKGQKFEIELETELIPGKVILEMKADALAEDKSKRKWLVERKSFKKKIPGEGLRFSDMQTTIYYWGFKKEGIDLDGVLWDYIKVKPPVVPKELKNGGLSKSKRIDTDYYTFYREIKKRGLNVEDYESVLEVLENKQEERFRRIFLPSPDAIVKNLIKDVKTTALEIYYLLGVDKSRNLGFQCERCQYYGLCQAELRGLDTEYMRKKDYKERRKDDEEKKTED